MIEFLGVNLLFFKLFLRCKFKSIEWKGRNLVCLENVVFES